MQENNINFAEFMQSKNWQKRIGETATDFVTRRKSMIVSYKDIIKVRGIPIVSKTIDGTLQILYSKEIDIEQVKMKAIADGQCKVITRTSKYTGEPINENQWLCPFCRNHEYLMPILFWKYPEGFLDKGGVMTSCICLKEREQDRILAVQEKKKQRKSEIAYDG